MLAALILGSCAAGEQPEVASTSTYRPVIPRTWDEPALASLQVPLAQPAASPRHVPADYYYRMQQRTIYRSFPVYHPDHEPPGYLERLSQLEPEVAFDASKLESEEDWRRAGQLVFEAGIAFDALNQVDNVRDREWYRKTGVAVAKDGIVPFFRYVVREKGKVSLAEFGCATCHTRVMPDGTVIQGAQGNYPLGWLDALSQQQGAAAAEDKEQYLERLRTGAKGPYGAPWLGERDPAAHYARLSLEETIAVDATVPPGVQARFGTSAFHPVQVPDLIGLRDRRYLDRTGLVRHRSIGDLMRYAAINQGMGFFEWYGDFLPAGELPEAENMSRYSDEQLYALAVFLYSLTPPENPNKVDAQSARGEKIFEREGCFRCHTPPLYTSNRLTPVDGFAPAADHPQAQDIAPMSVGTDPGLALYTRRGTGFYKVPSLRGVWYRGPFEHSGSVATLEDWFDPKRQRDDYVPTGFRGLGVTQRAVKGHSFGLTLSAEEKAALIAFLRTL